MGYGYDPIQGYPTRSASAAVLGWRVERRAGDKDAEEAGTPLARALRLSVCKKLMNSVSCDIFPGKRSFSLVHMYCIWT